MKYVFVYVLLLIAVFYTSCAPNETDLPEAYIKSAFRDTVTAYGPARMVRKVKQAKNGDILIAAFNGVFRYDGKSFTNITSRIPSPSFWDVLEDRKGNLWFGTRDSGIYLYNGRSFQHFTKKDGLSSNQALHVYEDKAGNIWAGASRYDGKSFRNFTTKDGFPAGNIRLILEDRTGRSWFGTTDNTFFYDGKTFTALKNKEGRAINNVWSIIEDTKGHIWIGGNGLWRYNGGTVTNITPNFTGNVYEDKKGNIWTTGEVKPGKPDIGNDWVLSRYDQTSLYDTTPAVTTMRSKYEGGKGMLCGILEADDGSIWFGSLTGVYRYDGKTVTDFRRKEDQK